MRGHCQTSMASVVALLPAPTPLCKASEIGRSKPLDLCARVASLYQCLLEMRGLSFYFIYCSSTTGSRQGSRAVRQLVYNASPRRDRNTSSFYSRPSQPLQLRDENYQPHFDHYRNSPEVPLQNEQWQPGQRLPINICSSQQTAPTSLQSIVQELQGTIERNFNKFQQRFDILEDRVASIEDKCKQFDTLHSTPPSSSSASESPSGMVRNRRSPPELQVCRN